MLENEEFVAGTALVPEPGTSSNGAALPSCTFSRVAGVRCDGTVDDTKSLNAALRACPPQANPITLKQGSRCTSRSLGIFANDTRLVLEHDAVLRARDR